MENKRTYVSGVFGYAPHKNAPEFIKIDLSIKLEDMYKSLKPFVDENGFVKTQVLANKPGGKFHYSMQINEFKPSTAEEMPTAQPQEEQAGEPTGEISNEPVEEEISPEDIPFSL